MALKYAFIALFAVASAYAQCESKLPNGRFLLVMLLVS